MHYSNIHILLSFGFNFCIIDLWFICLDNLLQCDSRMIMCDGHIRNLLEWSLKDIPKSKTCTGEIDSKDKIKESNIYFNKFEDKLRSHLLVDVSKFVLCFSEECTVMDVRTYFLIFIF